VNAVSERPLLNDRALEDEGKLGKTLDSHQGYSSCANAGPGRRKSQIYFSNMKTKNALKFDWAAFLRPPAILILEILCRDTDSRARQEPTEARILGLASPNSYET